MTLPTTLLAAALALTSPLTGAPTTDLEIVAPTAVATADAGVLLRSEPATDVPAARVLRDGAASMAVLAPTPSARPLHAGAAEEAHGATLLQSGRRGVPLMAAGGALLVAGLLIGGDVGTLVALGGAVIGAYGVFLYF